MTSYVDLGANTAAGRDDDADALHYLWTSQLDPLFWRLERTGVVSAWNGHVPFAHWIVRVAAPRMLVELGTHFGVSYAAFCEAVVREELDTGCFAIDTWQGDEHAGFYGEEVFVNLRAFHDARYAGFSRLLRCTFDEALYYFPDGCIDLLHIDGLHTYDAVRHDYESWLPKLSNRAVVLLHDINVRERNYGVWRLWEELRTAHPTFSFAHSHGLGVVAVGPQPPPDVSSLCGLRDGRKVSAVRQRFALLGERWDAEVRDQFRQQEIVEWDRRIAALEAVAYQEAAASPAPPEPGGPTVALQAEVERLLAELEAERTHAARLGEAERQMRARAAERSAAARIEAADAVARVADAERDWQRATARADAALQLLEAERRHYAAQRERPDDAASRLLDRPARRCKAAARRALTTLRFAFLTNGRQKRALRRQQLRDARLVLASPLFDAGWYAKRQRKLKGDRLDIALHYVRKGGKKLRNPSRDFDTTWYLIRYPDVAASGLDPLVHYLRHGRDEGREIRPVIESTNHQGTMADTAWSSDPLLTSSSTRATRLVWISGEPDTPGQLYRVARHVEAGARGGLVTDWMRADEIARRRDEIMAADVLVIWRAAWDEDVAAAVEAARGAGVRVVFDIDDLMFEPDLARTEIIDGIRSQQLTEAQVQEHYRRVRTTLQAADIVMAATEELAMQARRLSVPALVLPNGFDAITYGRSRLAARRRQRSEPVVRIGYAGGSRTHQRDFAVAAEALGQVLRERPQVRLVLFRDASGRTPILDIDEFPALRGLHDRIDWRNFVPLARLCEEIAQFDINIAPLEVGNPFCEAKSELKFFEAALVDVPTIASPTGPFRRAVRHGVNCYLASDTAQWRDLTLGLVDDPALRQRLARRAHRDVLWPFGPLRRAEAMASALPHLLGSPAASARALVLELYRGGARRSSPLIPETDVVFHADKLAEAEVTVVVPLYNYAEYIEEALKSVKAQTLATLDLIVVDDASTDASLDVAVKWAKANAGRFNRITVLRNRKNAGLGPTRNAGIDAADTLYVLPLDADNRLRPRCCEATLQAVRASNAAFVYPVIQQFGGASELMGTHPYAPLQFIGGNYIDAMALLSKEAWAGAGGYGDLRLGWEDFDLWCSLAELGLFGLPLAGEPLADYRVHASSMLRSNTLRSENASKAIALLERRHGWLNIVFPKRQSSASPASNAGPAVSPPEPAAERRQRLVKLLPLLRCPLSERSLTLADDGAALRSSDGTRVWPMVAGRPNLFPSLDAPDVKPLDHVSNPLPQRALELIAEAGSGLVLNLSAGGTGAHPDNVIEVDAAVFRNTDLLADAHTLPFRDGVFQAAIVLNAFEHYREPRQVARELYRVLRPGGMLLVHTAFMQPLHEAPWHFYNCTRYGLQQWFEAFETDTLHVSANFSPGHSIAWLASECERALRQDASPAEADAFADAPIGNFVALWRGHEAARWEDRQWQALEALPQPAQEAIAAGFEYVGRRPAA